MPEKVNNNYIILKGRFKAIDTNTFGLFLVFLNTNLRVAENISVIASHFSSAYETDPKGSWSDMEERILSLKWKGEFATSISRDIENAIDTSLKSERGEDLYSMIKQSAVGKIENMLFGLLMKPLGEKNIHIEFSWENATEEEIRLAKEARETKNQEEGGYEEAAPAQQTQASSEFDLEEGAVLLDMDLILAPVSGIPIFELQAGDKIMIKINPSTNRGRYFIDLLNAMQDDEVIPIPATVYGVKINKFNEYAILVKIGEGIYGRATETEQVKLKRFDPAQDQRKAQNAQKKLASAGFGDFKAEVKEDKTIKNLYWLMIAGGLIVVSAILFIIISLI